MKKLAIRLLAAVLTLSTGIGVAVYVKHRAHARRCAESSYFPAGVFGENNRRAEWLSNYYSAQGEPTFSCLDEDVEAYRLLFLPSFDFPTSIRIWRERDQYFMTIKQLEAEWLPGDGGKGLKLSSTRPLKVNEWAHFNRLLTRANFWSMPSPDVREAGLDGFSFTLEGKREGQYHVAYRWVPEDESFVDACEYLLEIASLEWRQAAK
jgi:hypothetical protein